MSGQTGPLRPRGETRTEVLRAIKAHRAEHDCSPTVREIAEAVGLRSTSTVHAHLQTLERLGYIERGSAGLSRQWRLVSEREEH